MAKNYSIEELKFKDGSEAEQDRTRKVFEDLKSKASKGGKMTEHEKDFFCKGLELSRLNDGSINAYACCDNYKFKYLYLIYFRDLTGGSKYRKIGMNAKPYFVTPSEADGDLKYLIDKAEEWENVIAKDASDQLLQQTIVEARKDIKILDNLPEILNDPYAHGRFYYRYKRWAILLHFRWVYCFGLEYFEATDPKDLIIRINEVQIEFSEFSLVHVLNRHYAQITKQYTTDKSYHIEDFEPRVLSKQMKNIIEEIDASGVIAGKTVEKIAFRYKRIDYLLWTAKRTKSIKNVGNVNYTRVETFYPVMDPQEVVKLESNYNLVKIREGLEVFVQK